LLAAAILLASWVALTGALHLDGLADSADAWIGGLGSRERTLAIMKDPRSGPAGVIALVLTLLLKFAALASMQERWPALLLAPMLGRAGLTALFVWMPYVRRDGLGSALTGASGRACRIAIAGTGLACVLCGRQGICALAAAALVWLLWRRACMKRIGGFTGDTAGAAAELIETSVLIVLALTA
jgi:adenosylcobinamide-GDP ribazoletransferase